MSDIKLGILCCFLVGMLTCERAIPRETTPTPQETDDRAMIEKGVEAYVEAFNNKDADAVISHWSADGVYIDRATGERIAGKDALKASLQAIFETAEKLRLNVEIEAIDFVSPSVAIERGTSTMTIADGESAVTGYTAVHVKQDGRWVVDRLSERQMTAAPTHYEQLKDLAWMIGNWTDQAEEDVVTTECHWARNKNFLVRSFTVSMAGDFEMAGMQIIGWDPATQQIRSWTFDSDGGFNQGVWKKSADTWAVQLTATLPDGSMASSTSLLTPLDENSFAWEQINRVSNGELLPNLPKIVIQRQASE